MVRPKIEAKTRQEVAEYFRTGRTLRVAAVYLTLASKGPTMRFEEIWDATLVREYVSSKSVLHDTLEYMSRSRMVRIERISRKVTRVTLLIKPPEVLSKEIDSILESAASAEAVAKRVTSNIEAKKISSEQADKLVWGLFIEGEVQRLQATVSLLKIYRDPILWPYLWGHLIELLVILPTIFHLQILRACEDTYPEATRTALISHARSLSNVLNSDEFREYQEVSSLLAKTS
jgi:hypothetical protein